MFGQGKARVLLDNDQKRPDTQAHEEHCERDTTTEMISYLLCGEAGDFVASGTSFLR